MDVTLAYDQPTQVTTRDDATSVALATDAQRPAAFAGRVRDPLRLRQLLLALHGATAANVSGKGWLSETDWRATLDPIVTIHPDQVIFETYSTDGSCYARLTAAMSAFEDGATVQPGTTNIDFAWDLRPLLATLRSSHPTTLAIGSAADMTTLDRVARQATLPDQWVKGALQVQGALTAQPFNLHVRPVDLASIITYLDEHKTRRSPQAMRYEFTPGAPIAVVLEPWNARLTLRGPDYAGYPRVVRLWGRQRLRLLRGVLPFADRVTVLILGRGLPHVYICQCGPYQFMLAISGWTADDWTMGSSFDLLAAFTGATAERTQRVYALLAERQTARREEIAAATGIPSAEVEQALFQLSRAGRVLYDPLSARYRARDLFAAPLDLEALFVADPRVDAAQVLLEGDRVAITSVRQGGSRARPTTRISATVHDDIDYSVEVQIDENGRLRYGKCQCAFFRLNTITRGPCAHILAARLAFDTPGPTPSLHENPPPGEPSSPSADGAGST
jgi:hypothetical protein